MLKLDKVTAGYGRMPVLQNVTMSVDPGKIVGVIGSNGAGKSTTLKAIMRSIPMFAGSITLDGLPLGPMKTSQVVANGISLVPEGRKIFGGLSVIENLRVGAYLRPAREIKTRLDEILELFPRLAERRDSMGASLSGGEQQMLAIGRALMSGPKILLLDEPSMGLAPIVMEQVFHTIEVLRKRGCTVLLVEQNARGALSLVDYAYVLENGRLVMQDTGKALLANSKIAEAYLGAQLPDASGELT
jgi:branched-chain amino acid transport system ATP-binding protein